jgi:hypothetical protein
VILSITVENLVGDFGDIIGDDDLFVIAPDEQKEAGVDLARGDTPSGGYLRQEETNRAKSRRLRVGVSLRR